MRTLEVLLLLVDGAAVMWSLFPARRPRRLVWLVGTAVFLAILHLVLEGYRWQMVPAYAVTAVLFLSTLIWRRRPQTYSPVMRRLTAGLAGLVFLGLALALSVLLPVSHPLPPTGPYAVGSTVLYLVDAGRDEIYTPDPDDKRELMAQLWYPAAPPPNAEPMPFLENIAVAGPALAEQFNLPSFLFDHVNLSRTQSYPDAPPVETDAPVIIFSHGLTGFRGQNTTMAQELASYGYVVAALDHTYANLMTAFPDGRTILYDGCRIFADCRTNPREGARLVGQWAEDIRFLLDEMTIWNGDAGSRFYGRFDLSRVGVFGHSTGGGTAVEFCYRDARCQAGLGLDAWTLPVSEAVLADPLTQPFMFISTPVWLGPDNAARGQAIYESVQNDAYNLAVTDTGHYDFSDLPLFSPLTPQLGLSGAIDSETAVRILNAYALAFFDRHLRGEESPLLAGTAVYPEVTFEKRNGRQAITASYAR